MDIRPVDFSLSRICCFVLGLSLWKLAWITCASSFGSDYSWHMHYQRLGVLVLAMIENKLFELLKSCDEECWTMEQKPDGNYHVMYKKHMINNDGSDAGWLYTDVPNARLDEHDKYVIEPPKEDKIGNRAERRKSKRKKR